MKPQELFGSAKWVSPNGKSDTPYIRGEFTVKKEVAKAEINICGLGFFKLFINGKKVSNDLFTPANSEFHFVENHCFKAFGERLSCRIYSMKYDVKEYLAKENCIGVSLGAGWYKNDGVDAIGNDFSFGEVKLCFKLEITYTDGTRSEILSSKELKWTQSPIVFSRIRRGDNHDYDKYRLDGWNLYGYDDTSWENIEEINPPESEYYIQDFPSDKVIRKISPKLIKETEDGYIYDMGENIAGTPVIKAKNGEVCEIELTCSERLDKNGNIEEYTTHNQKSTFITDGSNREYRLEFSFYAFRYAMVSKNAEIIDCEVIHSDVPVNSSFKSDNELLNWIYDSFIRTQLDNIHCCIPSDCPHIERQGYTGDGQLTCETVMMLFDCEKMYRKWLKDISDCQDTISGHVQYTAPYSHSGGGPGGWGCAIIEVPYNFYKRFGDKSILEDFIPKALKYFEYLDAHSENDLVTSDQPGLWCLGDWATPGKVLIPEPFVNNYFYVKSINRVIESCEITGKEELIPELEKLKERKVKAMIDAYFDPKTGNFANNVQGANAFAIDLGLGDERTMANIIKRYTEHGMYDTGIFGTDVVTRILFEKGYEKLAFELLTSKKEVSFNTWKESGATTLPENWDFDRSQNHPMFGAVVRYFFMYLLGIKNAGVAFDKIKIEPKFVDGLNKAEGHITVNAGEIKVKFEKCDNTVNMEIAVPENIEAEFVYDGKTEKIHCGTTKLTLAK